MNLGPLIVLFRLFGGTSRAVSPNGPAEVPKDVIFKPACPPGYYASKDSKTGNWSCLLIPKGR
jgi:hypothetical protein